MTEMFDRFFDCLNSSSLSAGKRPRNPFRSPIQIRDCLEAEGKFYGIPLHRSSFICTWLSEVFLPYLDELENCVDERVGFD